MKKSILALSAIAGIVYLSSCGNDQPAQTGEPTYTQAQLDSIAQAKADSAAAAQAAANDSLLNKMAADSIAAAEAAAAAAANTKTNSGKTTVTKPATTKPTTTKPTAKEPVKETPKADPKGDRFSGNKTDNSAGKAGRFNNEAAKEQTKQENADAKGARFNK